MIQAPASFTVSVRSHRAATWAALGAILAVATALRLWGIGYDLPYIYDPDEPVNVNIVYAMFRNGDPNPHFFGYPSLLYYVNVLAYELYYGVGLAAGHFQGKEDVAPLSALAMGVTRAPLPGLILTSRALTVAFGVGTVLLTFVAGRRLLGSAAAALLAAFVVAANSASVGLGRTITPDTLATFFVVATLLAAERVASTGRLRDYAFAGLLAGLAASAKYNCGAVALVALAAHYLRDDRGSGRATELVVLAICIALGFLAATPFALLDLPTFVEFLKFEGRHYTGGHPGMEGDTLRWYVLFGWSTLGLVFPLAVIGIIRAGFVRDRRALLVAVFPLVYFPFIASFVVRNDRTFLPLIPFVALLAASLLPPLRRFADRRPGTLAPKVVALGSACIVALALAQMVLKTIDNGVRLTTPNSRETARAWIEANLPAGAKLAIESYSPYVDTKRFSVQGFHYLIAHDADWYASNEFDYVVASQGMYGRYFRQPDRYPNEVARYEALFASLGPVRVFDDGGYEIRVHRVPRPTSSGADAAAPAR